MVASFPWQLQSSRLKVQIFGSDASVCVQKEFLNLDNIILLLIIFVYNKRFRLFLKCVGFLLSYGLLNCKITQ